MLSSHRYMLYAYNKQWPSSEMQVEKLKMISSAHDLVYSHQSAQGKTVTAVFVKKA